MTARNSGGLLGAVLIWFLLAACSSHGDHVQTHSSDQGNRERTLVYLAENFPTRDQMLSVRECVTERTEYEFSELPADFGPEYLTKTPPKDDPRPPNEVYDTHVDCAFDLGLEDRFFPPWDHEALRDDEAFGASRTVSRTWSQ